MTCSLSPRSDITLKQALESLDDQLEEERRALVAKQVEQAKQEAARVLADQEAASRLKIAEAERQAIELVGEQTAAKILAEAQAEKQRMEATMAEQKAKAAQEQLEAAFNRDLPEIRRYLVAFLSDGFELRGSSAGKGPASWNAIVGEQVLQPGRPGMEKLMHVCTYKNDRPRGPISMYIGGDNGWAITDKEAVGRAQELLGKYGELMVKNGLLAP